MTAPEHSIPLGINHRSRPQRGSTSCRPPGSVSQQWISLTPRKSPSWSIVTAISVISGSDPDRLAQHLLVIEAASPSTPVHKATEDALTYTIVRNTWYIENYLQSLGGPRRTGILAASTGDPVVAAATRKDLGEALVAVVVRESAHQDKRSRTISGS
ncbi:hypothetical protein [Mycolicibacterium chlorophenolicum]|uniref:Uncharacterized protein n=1 Tax=Mycolicibacterium chlorophenolicum TaxID=37916 RepID=A0A0J6VLZ8_9MYCO|nr:hypothetical protein [Mycolicibacterium chlorophenolicum]KMO70552.1 hypothetical protein MCHLDSM_05444 [Mycolicibacterium chlorophenolicum]